MEKKWFKLFVLLILRFCIIFSTATDTITQDHPIKDPESIISINKTYELGFFSPANTTDRYVGIWFGNIPLNTTSTVKTVVWVANRNKPLKDSSGTLAISKDGNIVLLNGGNGILWSSNVSNALSNSTAQLLDSGNFVLFGNSNETLWESFKFPTDSLLKNMRLTSDANTKELTEVKSWKSPSNPTVGSFSAGMNPLAIPELFAWYKNHTYWRSGPWDGQAFIGITDMDSVYLDGFSLVDDKNGHVYFTFAYARVTKLAHYVLSPEGSLLAKFWNRETGEWETTWSFPENECDYFAKCGSFGSCNSKDSPICSCLRGYKPKHSKEWDSGNFTSGCARRIPWECGADGFLKMTTMKSPESPELSFSSEADCRNECLQNCSCIAYSYNQGIGCMSWSGSLVDIQKLSTAGTDLYLRVPSSELDQNKKNVNVIIAISVVAGSAIVAFCAYLYWLRRTKQKGKKKRRGVHLVKSYSPFQESLTEFKHDGNLNHLKLEELPLFKLEVLSVATDNFPLKNKVGQGGFGAVYKGKLKDGKEIAVKRLSRSSGQGLEEFMNEVVLISKLQHRNLVRLLGCCIEGEEKMLVYEYMPKKSLDAFLFDPQSQELLDWSNRLRIIEGIGRGLLYLHRDSRLRIIHRDLKASNILLDEELNPKISDFGMARIFGGPENQANTQRVVGTYGYMAPEYAMNGEFSEKSDVFSFGVLLLEIVSGRRNTSFYNDDKYLSLLQFAWTMWDECNVLAILDLRIPQEGFEKEILRCIHVGLLCVQELAVDRPIISTVLSMLSSEVACLTKPKQPAFTQRSASPQRQNSQQQEHSLNGCTVTAVNGRNYCEEPATTRTY